MYQVASTPPFFNLHVFEGGIHSWVSISLWPLRQRRTVAGASASRRSDDQRAGGAIVSSAAASGRMTARPATYGSLRDPQTRLPRLSTIHQAGLTASDVNTV